MRNTVLGLATSFMTIAPFIIAGLLVKLITLTDGPMAFVYFIVAAVLLYVGLALAYGMGQHVYRSLSMVKDNSGEKKEEDVF